MASTAKISMRALLQDLGMPLEMSGSFTADLLYSHYQYLQQTTADTEQTLSIGNITTVDCIIIIARDNDLLVDTSFDTTFSSELTISEGQFAVIKPSGVVTITNSVAGELCTLEYIVVGD